MPHFKKKPELTNTSIPPQRHSELFFQLTSGESARTVHNFRGDIESILPKKVTELKNFDYFLCGCFLTMEDFLREGGWGGWLSLGPIFLGMKELWILCMLSTMDGRIVKNFFFLRRCRKKRRK
jgi:hypothetical protein